MSFKTPKGTELRIINLKGKDYLGVQERVRWFREEHPSWTIKTAIVQHDENFALSKAEILDETGRLIASGHKTETLKGFGDYVEKSETGAIGRALALCGYGTQFTTDFDEGTERIVDSPRASIPNSSVTPDRAANIAKHTGLTTPNAEYPSCPSCGKKMMKSKFPDGAPFWCPPCNDKKKASKQSKPESIPPPEYDDGEFPF